LKTRPKTNHTVRRIVKYFTFVILGIFIWAPESSAQQLKPAKPFKDCKECPELMVVPIGSFIMGSKTRHKQEHPPHKVTISKPFAIGRYETTFDQWDTCFRDGGCSHNPNDHKWGRGKRPVINVTITHVNEYLSWISKKTKQTYRLPSEAEWEYAARAGTTTEYWWGNDIGKDNANCRHCLTAGIPHETFPTGTYNANPFGLYDTSGNVWEWTLDCWNKNHTGATQDGSPRLTGKCTKPVMKGGSWYYIPKNARPAWRAKNDYRAKSYGIGFRVVREIR
jgi:formylglycine-generating enzyme required for sulfatase activity